MFFYLDCDILNKDRKRNIFSEFYWKTRLKYAHISALKINTTFFRKLMLEVQKFQNYHSFYLVLGNLPFRRLHKLYYTRSEVEMDRYNLTKKYNSLSHLALLNSLRLLLLLPQLISLNSLIISEKKYCLWYLQRKIQIRCRKHSCPHFDEKNFNKKVF